MILIDARPGSRELLTSIRNLGVNAEIAGKLASDFQWTGNGPDGPVLCGVERKQVQELLGSMRDGRLEGQQVEPMLQTYDIRYLVIEGTWRRGRETAMIEIPVGAKWSVARGSYRYSELMHFLASLRERADYRVWRSANVDETVAYLVEEYRWWQKDWDAHRTGTRIYIPDCRPARGHKPMFRARATVTEKWLHALPHLDSRVTELARLFPRPRDIGEASEDFWTAIKGVGKVMARDIVAAVNGKD